MNDNGSKLFNNWREKILDWTKSDAGGAGNKNLRAFDLATDPSAGSQKTRLQAILSVPDALILGVGDGNKIILIHNAKNLGGTLLRPDDKVVALVGVSHEAKGVELDLSSALASYEVKAAKFAQMTSCSSTAELKELNETSTRTSFLN